MEETLEMTDNERSNTDKLEFYWQEKVKVHIILKQKLYSGQNKYSNGIIVDRLSPRLWKILDDTEGSIEISIASIVPDGVSQFREVSV